MLVQPLISFCFDRMRRKALVAIAMTSFCFYSSAQPAELKDTDLSALRQDVDQLKAQQQRMLASIEQIKLLLLKSAAHDTTRDFIFATEVSGEPFKGHHKASLVIIEYGDFQCPYCRNFENDTFPEIRDNYIKTGKVRFYFRDLPLKVHTFAMPAARAARCAADQGRFWPMHDELLAGEPMLSSTDLDQHARNVGLDVTKLDACEAGDQYAAAIKKGIDEATQMGVHATPTFLIGNLDPNGTTVKVKKLLVGSHHFDVFKELIDPLLAANAGSATDSLSVRR